MSTEKSRTYEVELSFIWGKMTGYSQEGSTSEALRDCSKGTVGGRPVQGVLVKTEFSTITHSFYLRFSASSRGSDVTMKGVSALGPKGLRF